MVTIENHIGKISVSEKCLTELIHHTVCSCFGVTDVCSVTTFGSAVSTLTGGNFCKDKGVAIRINKNGSLSVDLHIKVTYGTNISATVKSIIHKVTFTVEDIVGIDVNEINVYVDDMNY
ncbi:MAG: Asp23/Gls24 family envelope stress response protein [Ruminococcus sp.]|nr:Asp23/Gls24 family envelope stress response protein [Ruminococcus sp.]MDE7104557.1 Asp23/Gls24 family envelope stress response protein [Ruminococcus sp.]